MRVNRPWPRFYSFGYLLTLSVLMGVYVLVSYVSRHSIVEVPLGLLALLIAPGYAVAALLFARQSGLSWTIHLPISVGFSVVYNVLVGIALLRAGPGLSTRDGALADFLLVAFCLVLFLALPRAKTAGPSVPPVTQELIAPLRALQERLRLVGYSRRQGATAIILLVLIFAVLGFIGYVAVAEPHPGFAVSLAIYGPTGSVVSLPSGGTNTTALNVIVSIANNATAQGFEILVKAELSAHLNAPPAVIPWTQPLRLAPATESALALQLGAGKSTTVPVSFYLAQAGNYTVSFSLANAVGSPLAGQSIDLPLIIT